MSAMPVLPADRKSTTDSVFINWMTLLQTPFAAEAFTVVVRALVYAGTNARQASKALESFVC